MTSRTISKRKLERALANYGDFSAQLAALPSDVAVSIDSRTIKKGEIFLAIRGDLNDGHKYISDVNDKGAALIIADQNNSFCSNTSMILVPDTLRLLGDIAHAHLGELSCTRIGITGSNGKTTTKEMVKAALTAVVGADQVYASVGNKNNLFGLPLCALEVNHNHRFAIFEMGMNQIGEMDRLCAIVKPHLAAITNISGAHEGNFADGLVGIRHEKGALFRSISHSQGHAVINVDDDNIVHVALSMDFKSRTSFGHAQGAAVRILGIAPFSLNSGAQIVTMSIDDTMTIEVSVPLAGAHHAMNAACALAVIKALGLCIKTAATGIKSMNKVAGRMSVVVNKQGYIVINDGYNANPVSMKAGIEASLGFQARRRIAVIGAMGELGHTSAKHHFELGQLLAHNFHQLFICGEDAREAVAGAREAGMEAAQILFFNSSLEIIDPLKAFIREGDLVFIKGSLSANMQAVASSLLSN